MNKNNTYYPMKSKHPVLNSPKSPTTSPFNTINTLPNLAKDICILINFIRTNTQEFISYLSKTHSTKEKHITEILSNLKEITDPLSPYILIDEISLAAKDYLNYIINVDNENSNEKNGENSCFNLRSRLTKYGTRTGRIFESVVTRKNSAEEIVFHIMKESKGRNMILSPKMKYIGIACGLTLSNITCTVIDIVQDFKPYENVNEIINNNENKSDNEEFGDIKKCFSHNKYNSGCSGNYFYSSNKNFFNSHCNSKDLFKSPKTYIDKNDNFNVFSEKREKKDDNKYFYNMFYQTSNPLYRSVNIQSGDRKTENQIIYQHHNANNNQINFSSNNINDSKLLFFSDQKQNKIFSLYENNRNKNEAYVKKNIFYNNKFINNSKQKDEKSYCRNNSEKYKKLNLMNSKDKTDDNKKLFTLTGGLSQSHLAKNNNNNHDLTSSRISSDSKQTKITNNSNCTNNKLTNAEKLKILRKINSLKYKTIYNNKDRNNYGINNNKILINEINPMLSSININNINNNINNYNDFIKLEINNDIKGLIHKNPRKVSLSPSYVGININPLSDISTKNNFETQNNENKKNSICLNILNNLLSDQKNNTQNNYSKFNNNDSNNNYLSLRQNNNCQPKIIKSYDEKMNKISVNMSGTLNNNSSGVMPKKIQCKNKNEMKKLIKLYNQMKDIERNNNINSKDKNKFNSKNIIKKNIKNNFNNDNLMNTIQGYYKTKTNYFKKKKCGSRSSFNININSNTISNPYCKKGKNNLSYKNIFNANKSINTSKFNKSNINNSNANKSNINNSNNYITEKTFDEEEEDEDKNNSKINPFKIKKNVYIKAKTGGLKKGTYVLKLSRSFNEEKIPKIINNKKQKKLVNYFNRTSNRKAIYGNTINEKNEQNEIGNSLLSGSDESRIKTSRKEYANALDKDLYSKKQNKLKLKDVPANSKKFGK